MDGLRLLNTLYEKSIQSGNPKMKLLYQSFQKRLMKVLLKKLSAWLFFGDLRDPLNEFFIMEKVHEFLTKHDRMNHFHLGIYR